MIEWISKYFEPSELLSPAGIKQLERGNLMLQPFAIGVLDQFREFVGVPLLCNHRTLKFRGYRSPRENETIGGAEYSRHIQGIAFDLSSALPVAELFERAKEFGKFGGLGFYPYKKFLHVDCRYLLGDPVIWIG